MGGRNRSSGEVEVIGGIMALFLEMNLMTPSKREY